MACFAASLFLAKLEVACCLFASSGLEIAVISALNANLCFIHVPPPLTMVVAVAANKPSVAVVG